MNKEERLLTWGILILAFVAWLGITPTNVSAMFGALGASLSEFWPAFIIVGSLIIAMAGSVILMWNHNATEDKLETKRRIRHFLLQAIGIDAVVMAVLLSVLAIILGVLYEELTAFGTVFFAVVTFSLACSIGLAIITLRHTPDDLRSVLPLFVFVGTPLYFVLGFALYTLAGGAL